MSFLNLLEESRVSSINFMMVLNFKKETLEIKGKRPSGLIFYHVKCVFLMGRCHNEGRGALRSHKPPQTAFVSLHCHEHMQMGHISSSCAAVPSEDKMLFLC